MLRDHLDAIRQRIQQACQRSGRDSSSVTLVCVTKGIPLEVIQQAIRLGVTDIGENRVQEVRAKRIALGFKLQASSSKPQATGSPEPAASSLQPAACSVQPVRWHLIGHLQRNKVKDAVELFDVIHSIDSHALIQELERHMAKKTRPIDVFVQVNVSGEPTKFGCRPEEAGSLAQTIVASPHLRLRGLMTIAPFSEDAETARPVFRQLRALRDQLLLPLRSLSPVTGRLSLQLSMGMSHDFEVAIEEGADVVRLGTAIFGTGDKRQETGAGTHG